MAPRTLSIGAKIRPVREAFQAGCGFTIGDFDIASFTIPHDAADPVGLHSRRRALRWESLLIWAISLIPCACTFAETDFLLLESNHDLEMLRVGPYPWSVKQRVMSRRGHLSNEVAASFIGNDLDCRISTLC